MRTCGSAPLSPAGSWRTWHEVGGWGFPGLSSKGNRTPKPLRPRPNPLLLATPQKKGQGIEKGTRTTRAPASDEGPSAIAPASSGPRRVITLCQGQDTTQNPSHQPQTKTILGPHSGRRGTHRCHGIGLSGSKHDQSHEPFAKFKAPTAGTNASDGGDSCNSRTKGLKASIRSRPELRTNLPPLRSRDRQK